MSMNVGPNNPYVSKSSNLCRKIDLFDSLGQYVRSTRAYDSIEKAIKGARFSGYAVDSGKYSYYGERT